MEDNLSKFTSNKNILNKVIVLGLSKEKFKKKRKEKTGSPYISIP